MARVVELEVIKGLPVSPVRPVAVDKPPPPAPVGADAKPAVVVNRGLPGPGMLPTPAAAEYKRTQPPRAICTRPAGGCVRLYSAAAGVGSMPGPGSPRFTTLSLIHI